MKQIAVTENNQTLDSREVAEMVGKGHNELLKDVRRYIGQFNEGNLPHVDFFQESTYQDGKGEERPCFEVTRKGCEFIANKLTGVKGTEFTAKYINRFHAMEKTIQTGLLDGLSTEMKALLMHDQKIQVVESRVDKLENNMVIDHGQGKELQDLGRNRVMAVVGGKKSIAYDEIGKKVFAAIWRDFKNYFNIASYHNTPVARIVEARHYLKSWVPDNNLQLQINAVNRGDV